MCKFSWLVFTAYAISVISIEGFSLPSNQSFTENNITDHRNGKKMLNIFAAVVKIPANTQCNASNNLKGTCVRATDCTNEGGVAYGECAKGFGVCCIYAMGCGQATSRNYSYFTSNGLSFANNLESNGGNGLMYSTRCELKVKKASDNVCQLRLDFLTFVLNQPDGNGDCITDQFLVTGAANIVPTICGENTHQHMMLYAKPGQTEWTLRFVLNNNKQVTVNRNWNIKLTQILCDSTLTSDPSCLQYFTSPSGRIKSFNFDFVPILTTSGLRAQPGRQLSNQNYAICVRSEDGYCGIKYTACPDPVNGGILSGVSSSFVMTGDLNIPPVMEALSGIFCQWDYLEIPAGYYSPNPIERGITTDRYCGQALNPNFLATANVPITTYSKPFQLRYVTDGFENTPSPINPLGPDGRNTGFCIDYSQISCNTQR